MTTPTVQVGNETVGKIATGLMRLTWAPENTPDEQAFELIKTSIDSGANFLNSGSFYGTKDPLDNLKLLSRFCEANPEYKDKFLLSVKGGLRPGHSPCGELGFLREDIKQANDVLKHRKMDFFEIARVDKEVGIEQMMKNLLTLRDEGHFKYISLSEVGADSIKKAAAIGKVDLVEVEYSPFCLDIEKNGVLATCKELDIPILAYSPLGAGFLGAGWKSKEDIPQGDMRRNFDRFSDENFAHNLKLANKLQEVAEKKGVTAAQLAIAWVGAQWEKIIPLPGSTKTARVRESIQAGRLSLSADELKEIRDFIDNFEVKGVRYANNPQIQGRLFG
ncbi:hypothetical protein JCM6882_006906 [Rhodosporidiobolus microsporus]